jgi:hypothetical protein
MREERPAPACSGSQEQAEEAYWPASSRAAAQCVRAELRRRALQEFQHRQVPEPPLVQLPAQVLLRQLVRRSQLFRLRVPRVWV